MSASLLKWGMGGISGVIQNKNEDAKIFGGMDIAQVKRHNRIQITPKKSKRKRRGSERKRKGEKVWTKAQPRRGKGEMKEGGRGRGKGGGNSKKQKGRKGVRRALRERGQWEKQEVGNRQFSKWSRSLEAWWKKRGLIR